MRVSNDAEQVVNAQQDSYVETKECVYNLQRSVSHVVQIANVHREIHV